VTLAQTFQSIIQLPLCQTPTKPYALRIMFANSPSMALGLSKANNASAEVFMALFAPKGGLSKAALKKLLEGGPIMPKHDHPSSLAGDGYAGSTLPHEFSFFEWFDLFAELANRQMGDEPWRFQEKSNTVLSSSFEGPSYGRRYDIFHNQLKIGLIEVSADVFQEFTPDAPYVNTEIKLEHVRLLPFHEVIGFLNWVAGRLAVGEDQRVPVEIKMQNLTAMTECLWPVEELDDPAWTELSVMWDGKATHYIHWRAKHGSA